MAEERGVILRLTVILGDLLGGVVHDRHTIANKLGVALAAGDRYIRHLVNVPGVVASHEGRRLTIRFDFGEAAPRPSHPTAVAACWASGLAEVFAGSDYERGVRDALAYVTGRARRSGEFKNVDRKFIFVSRGGESSLPDTAEQLDELIDAVLRSRYAAIDYVHFDGKEERIRIQPLSMAIYDHQLYVVARRIDTAAVYPFRLSRIQSVDVDHESFEYPDRAVYDPKQLFRDSFGIFISESNPVARVRVLLDKKWRVHCHTHRWHQSQRIEEVADGIVVTVVARVCWELKAWILGFGPDALVLEPAVLVDEIRSMIAQMDANYRSASKDRAGPQRATTKRGAGQGASRPRRKAS
jgi:predicted DNA-binding transcriptional regulator YafY